MIKLTSVALAAVFAAVTMSPAAFAQDQKKQQIHKGTPEQGTVQKKEHKQAKKKDGTGKAKAAPEK